MEKIDILMAVYNGEKYLKEQIDSILNQTYTNFRLIISDDNSKDGTSQILEEYEKKDDRIKVYYQKENLGSTRNFEFLLKKVENKYYMLSDQDDIWMPEKIEKSFNTLIKQNADLVFTDLEVVNEKGKTISNSFNTLMKLKRKIEKTSKTYKLEYLYNCVTGCTIIARTEFLKYILPIPKNSKHVIHDYWIAIVTSIKGKVVYLSESLIKYRQHEKNQVGIVHKVDNYKTLEEIRNHFIDVKLGVFKTYIENKEIFPEQLQKQNEKVYKYYEMLKQKSKINFKGWTIFNKLYKNETLKYYIENFFILNIPCIAKILIKIKIGG